jgi:hypothetical protein
MHGMMGLEEERMKAAMSSWKRLTAIHWIVGLEEERMKAAMSSWKRLTAIHGIVGLEEERMKASNELVEMTDSYAWDDGTRRREDEGKQ